MLADSVLQTASGRHSFASLIAFLRRSFLSFHSSTRTSLKKTLKSAPTSMFFSTVCCRTLLSRDLGFADSLPPNVRTSPNFGDVIILPLLAETKSCQHIGKVI